MLQYAGDVRGIGESFRTHGVMSVCFGMVVPVAKVWDILSIVQTGHVTFTFDY